MTDSTLILLPTYQEVANIRQVVPLVRQVVPDAHILVVDDSSPDGTADVADELAAELGQVEVLRRPTKEGLGAAYRAAVKWGLDHGYDVFVLMDADLSHDPHQLPDLLSALDHDVDIVLGSRYIPGGSIPDWTPSRRFLSKYGNLYVRALLRLPIHDATTGFRVWRSGAVKETGFIDTSANGYGFVIESNYRAARAGMRIVEVPIRFLDRSRGQSKMSGRIVLEALSLVTWWGLRDRLLRRKNQTAPPRPTSS